ncbi:MAG: hypothetical protein ACE5GM_05675, partial [bacterium]
RYEGTLEGFHETADDYRDFLDKIEKCLKEDSREKQEKRREYARQNSWRKRIEEIARYIDNN